MCMSDLERLFKIKSMITRHGYVPKQDFLDKLEISTSTFKRDLEYLRDRMNSPIVFDRYHGGYGFEKKCEDIETSEIPDWYIKNIKNNKVIIGMNQLDLWGGGQQINRGSKYLIDCKFNNDKTKLLCVVCNEIKFKNKKNKAFNFFDIGFKNDTLCYLNTLETIIKKFLDN